MQIREYFLRRSLLDIGLLILVFCLLGGAAFAIWKAYTTPTERNEEITALRYTLSGDFGYDVHLTENALYETATITQNDTLILYLAIVESIEGNFSYKFNSDSPLNDISHEVSIVAKLQNGERWSKPVDLVPKTLETGDFFTITFPIDTSQLFELGDEINQDLVLTGYSYNLLIQADVHTVAPTNYGLIDKTFTQTMSGTLQPNQLTWTDTLSGAQSGSFQDTKITPVSTTWGKVISPIALAFVLLFGSYIAWNRIQAKSIPIPAVEMEARRARKRYKDIIIDVIDLPQSTTEQLIVPVQSLDDLAKTADQLLRPVLHKAEPESHTYCVIDGMIRYEYVSKMEEPSLGQ